MRSVGFAPRFARFASAEFSKQEHVSDFSALSAVSAATPVNEPRLQTELAEILGPQILEVFLELVGAQFASVGGGGGAGRLLCLVIHLDRRQECFRGKD